MAAAFWLVLKPEVGSQRRGSGAPFEKQTPHLADMAEERREVSSLSLQMGLQMFNYRAEEKRLQG